MATWHRKEVGNYIAAMAQTNKLHEAVLAYGVSVRGAVPAGFGVFGTHDNETLTEFWYFSPEAEVLAKQFDAQPCDMPTPGDGFALLAGKQESARLYFASYFNRRRG